MKTNLSVIDDESLVSAIRKLVADSNSTEAELLAHLAEFDVRKIYAAKGYSSLYVYCTEVLGLGKYTALERMYVARLAIRFPDVLERVRTGQLNLTALRLLVPVLREDNYEGVIAKALGRTTDGIRELVAEVAPKPAVPDSIRKLPKPTSPVVLAVSPLLPLGDTGTREESPVVVAPVAPVPLIPRKGKVEPLAPDAFKVSFTADDELRQLLEEAKALMSHRKHSRDLASLVKEGMVLLVAKLKKQRFGIGAKPRAKARPQGQVSRHVPVDVVRATVARDGLTCTFVAADGHRCGERAFLQLEHVEGFARTRRHSPDSLTVLCQAHNMLAADRLYGKDFMQKKRKPVWCKTESSASPSPAESNSPSTPQQGLESATSPR